MSGRAAMSGQAGADTIRCGDELAAALAGRRVDRVFGLLGSGIIRLVDRLVHEHRVPFHNARHEAVAVGMADGYARATGRIGVAAVTEGPGFTNTLTALVTAKRGRTPLVLVAGDSSADDPRRHPFSALQAIDQQGILAAAGVPSLRLGPADIVGTVASAFARAQTDATPVVLHLPSEVQHAAVARSAGTPADASGNDPPQTIPAPSAAAIGLAAVALDSARRPVVLAGLGAVRSGAHSDLVALAEHTGALLVTSLRASGFFYGHPWDLGVAGGYATAETTDILAAADCVVAFGASLNNLTTRRGTLFPAATIIQCDVDPAALGVHLDVAIAVPGDAKLTAQLLLAQCRRVGQPRTGYRDAGVAAALSGRAGASVDHPAEGDSQGDHERPGILDPRRLCARLDALLPPERLLVIDGGQFGHFVIDGLTVRDPGELMYMLDFGATGGGLGPAVGAALGRPDRLTVLFIGDGGLLMTLGDLETAARYRIPLFIVCMNNGAYGSEVQLARRHGFATDLAIFPTTDLAAVARSLGIPATTVTELAQLDALEGSTTALDGPHLLDCRISPSAVSRVMDHL